MTTRQKLIALLGTWSRPPDLPAKIALGLAALFLLIAIMGRGRTIFGIRSTDAAIAADEAHISERRFLGIAALLAALLSIAYTSMYLHGGSRIVDATTYFLQGRALSHGDLAWEPLEPSASFRGRFLYYDYANANAATGESGTLGGIFPPGYPLLLAIGFLLGSPMLIGPLLAGALIVATYKLSRAMAEELAPTLAEPIARAAVFLSLICAALRYHTSDTMSHGASALGITIALTGAIRARRVSSVVTKEDSVLAGGRGDALMAGLAVGYVFATRPASALPIAIVVGWLLRKRILLPFFAMLPGLFLLLLSQHAVTGSWFASTQRMYYASSDGPPGCYRWGFGKGTGCIFEHGEFVEARLAHGYGIVEALATTLRRLQKHLLDVANLEPLALLVLVPAFVKRRDPRMSVARVAIALIGLQVLAYLPFYFDGDYPGGGARFFADILPVEHALLACSIAVIAIASKSYVRNALLLIALSLVGFGVHASYEHGLLRDREGGRPYFEPDVLQRASVSAGLVFVDSDHGFALGHDPSIRNTKDHVVVARLRNDDRDRILYDALDRPPTWLYKIEVPVPPSTESTPVLTPWAPPDHSTWLRFEAESEWPALSQEGGFAAPGFTDACSSNKRALILTPTSDSGDAKAMIEVPVPKTGRYAIELHLTHGAIPYAPPAPLRFGAALKHPTDDGNASIANLTWTWKASTTCVTLPAAEAELVEPSAHLVFQAHNGQSIALDYVALRRVSP